MHKCFKWVKSFVIFVLLMCLMVTPCYAIMMPQATQTEQFSKTVNNPSASSQWNLVYSFDGSPYYTYRWDGCLKGNTTTNYNTFWEIRDKYDNVMASYTTNGTDIRLLDIPFATPFYGFKIYAKTSNTSVSSAYFSSGLRDCIIYYGSDVAEQPTVNQTLTAANTASTNAANAFTAATTASANAVTAASRALNNYNILNNTTKGLYKTYDVASSAATNTFYSGNTAAYLAYLASEDAGYVRDTLIPDMQSDIDSLTTTVTNINNTVTGDGVAPTIKTLAGENGATCTTSGTFYVIVSASDNSTGDLQAQASVDGGAYGSLVTLPNSIPVTLSPMELTR